MKADETDKLWQDRIRDFKESPLSLAKWCKLNDVKFSAMRYRLYQKPLQKRDKQEVVEFIPAKLVSPEESIPKQSLINLHIGSVEILVNDSTDLTLLKKIVEVLS